jgi:hypothetical protein
MLTENIALETGFDRLKVVSFDELVATAYDLLHQKGSGTGAKYQQIFKAFARVWMLR